MCYTLHTHREEMRGGTKVGFAVVHMMKIKSGAVGGIQSHNNREHEPKTNPDVDMSRSAENYDLIPCQNYQRAIKEKMSDLVESSRAVRKDAVVVCNFIVTSDNATMEALGADRQRAFFEDSVKWFSDRYGADRVLNATVHMDETTPHLHIGIVPITQDGRLSAKSIFTKTELKAIQTEFARDVGERYGLERGIEGSDRTHLSEIRYKQETAFAEYINLVGEVDVHQRALEDIQQDIETATQRLSEATQSLEMVKEELSLMESQKDALRGEITALGAKKERAEEGYKNAQTVLIKARDEMSEIKDTLPKMRQEKAELERELPVLSAQISEAKTELQTVETAIKKKMDEGAGHLGGMELVRQRIAEERAKQEQEKRMSLFERFVNLPAVRPLWEQFLSLVERENRSRGKGKSKGQEWSK